MTSNKKQQLFNSALTLFVKQGIDATSTASIAKHAQVANGTLFHHFQSKEQLVLSLYQHIKQEFSAQIKTVTLNKIDFKKQTQVLWDQAIDWAFTHTIKQQYCWLVQQYQGLPAQEKAKILAEEFSYLQQLICFGQEQQLLVNYPLALMLEQANSQFLASSRYFINHPTQINDPYYRNAVFDMFWRSFSL